MRAGQWSVGESWNVDIVHNSISSGENIGIDTRLYESDSDEHLRCSDS